MDENRCPLCHSANCTAKKFSDSSGYMAYHCKTYDVKFNVPEDTIERFYNDPQYNEEMEKGWSVATEMLLQHPEPPKYNQWSFLYCPNPRMTGLDVNQVNLAAYAERFPKGIVERVDRILLNISRKSAYYGAQLQIDQKKSRLLFVLPEDYDTQAEGILRIMAELGYISMNGQYYSITAKGWKHIEELTAQNLDSKTAFIAMSFREKTKPIRECFRQAIIESGFEPRLIDEKEHNNQIVPEIFYEIQKSRFVVVDVTYPNYGAYYEAGYAAALGKEVIICCREKEFNGNKESRPHFDIAQKSMIVWENRADLIKRLKERIEATVK